MAAPMSRIFLNLRNFHVLTTCLHGERCTSAIFLQNRSKHWNPKFRKERAKKVLKIELPEYKDRGGNDRETADEVRKKMKKEGKLPPRTVEFKPFTIGSTGGVFEEYVPPEGDGKSSLLSGTKDRLESLKMKGKSLNEVRKIKKLEENFDTKQFPSEALEIYIEAQKCLEDVKKNEDRLHDLVTERAYPMMIFGLEYKTFRWNFIESVEPARVVHVRTTDMLSKENLYAQVTVRFHTKQTLAMYDRFGRIMYGSENLIKDVLEYVVFEKHVSDLYGQWRIHDKIIPEWMPPREPLIKTYVKPKLPPLPQEEETSVSTSTSTETSNVSTETPSLVPA